MDQHFFKSEYDKIIHAHFESSERVTSFFKYLLLVYGAPLVIFNCTIKIPEIVSAYIFIVIAGAGFFICTYLIRLRMESLLYARTINGMRRFLLDHAGIDYFKLQQYVVLPIQTQKPRYYDTYQFIYIVATLALFNSAYLAAGLFCCCGYTWPTYISPIIFFVVHFINYGLTSRSEEAGIDFYKHIIGVDIDGVLNEHEQQFCTVIKEQNIHIVPEQIVKMPVREANIGVTEQNERAVFDNIKYWTEMPEKENASREMGRIKDQLGFKVYIFTWRDWGNKKWDINVITRRWLQDHQFKYNKLFFEKGNIYYPIGWKRALYKNRVYLSKKYKIKYFVEDDVDKAIPLSNVCKTVFLINHKYNAGIQLPNNVIRVDSWYEIFKHIKILG